MTRRGSIAYYLAAVVCGSFFLSASYSAYFLLFKGASSQNWARNFIFVYFFTVLLGLVPQILGAWALRRIATRLGWGAWWQWLLAGTAIFVAIVWGVGQLGLLVEGVRFPPEWMSAKVALMSVLVGPIFVALNPMWVPVPAAAATAWVLYSVHRAFAEHG